MIAAYNNCESLELMQVKMMSERFTFESLKLVNKYSCFAQIHQGRDEEKQNNNLGLVCWQTI